MGQTIDRVSTPSLAAYRVKVARLVRLAIITDIDRVWTPERFDREQEVERMIVPENYKGGTRRRGPDFRLGQDR